MNREGSWERKKEEIAANFSRTARYYDAASPVRREVGKRLIASLEPWKNIIPPGPIVELGCGTGFVTKALAELYPDRDIKAIDLSRGMIDYCKEETGVSSNISFELGDAEILPEEDPSYSLTVSGFMAHWLKDPVLTLGKWLEITKPGGLLLASFPGNESFPEWRNCCKDLGLPFTGNTLPDVEEMVIKMSLGPAQVDYYEDSITREYNTSLDFFRDLKRLGAGTQIGGRSLSLKEFSLLVNHWDSSPGSGVKVTYHIVFLAVKRD